MTAGDQAWQEQGGLPQGFFATGEAAAGRTTPDYWHVLAAWTRAVAEMLTPGERDLFWFRAAWKNTTASGSRSMPSGPTLGRLGRDGQPPGLDQALPPSRPEGLSPPRRDRRQDESYAIHPGVAEAGRAQAGKPFRDAVDAEAAAYWDAVTGTRPGRQATARATPDCWCAPGWPPSRT